ncbi:Heterokaryon incompatibility protein (HET) domain containing protein [Rhypophila sp. PSN 637]
MDESAPLLQSHDGPQLPQYTASTSTLYSQLALPPGEEFIRLLDLQAAPLGLPGAPLTAHLRVASLADQPTFTTLSYVWGSHASTRPWHRVTILPQRVALDVTENCFRALHRIRSGVGAVTIWVDSICINQQDEKEKTAQIPLMMKIYSLAGVGYNWLGESNEQLEQAIRFLGSRATISSRLPLAYLVGSSQEEHRRKEKKALTPIWNDHIKIPRHKGDEELASIQQLLGHPWTRRAWTFQELVLSKNPVFLCGENIILWEDIINATCLDDLSPDLASALRPWRSLAELWLSFPRLKASAARLREDPLDLRGIEEAVPYALYTFKELLDASWLYKLRTLRNTLYFGMLTSGYFLCFVAAGTIIFLAHQLPRVEPPKGHPWPPNPPWQVQVYSTSPGPGVLMVAAFVTLFNGIWTALAERASQDPRDKSFALSGILKAAGASPPLPDYSWSLRETYLKLFNGLVAWQPKAAGNMLLSAGISSSSSSSPEHEGAVEEESWPSWLPDWSSPEPNNWLVARYRIDHTIHAAPPHGSPSISAATPREMDRLSLRGHFVGAIEMCIRLEAIPMLPTTTDDHGMQRQIIILRNLQQITQWMRLVRVRALSVLDAYDPLPSALFAILQGLPRPRQTLMVEHTWEAPYDFTDCLDEFKAFEAFYQIVLGGGGVRGRREQDNMEDAAAALRRLQENEMTMGYFIRTVNKLVDKGRGLFILSNGMSGSGSTMMAEGDSVVLAPGIRAPILVRRSASTVTAHASSTTDTFLWKLVAPVLVHGLMYGEGAKELSLVNVELE